MGIYPLFKGPGHSFYLYILLNINLTYNFCKKINNENKYKNYGLIIYFLIKVRFFLQKSLSIHCPFKGYWQRLCINRGGLLRGKEKKEKTGLLGYT